MGVSSDELGTPTGEIAYRFAHVDLMEVVRS
jgi:hypothetical protein